MSKTTKNKEVYTLSKTDKIVIYCQKKTKSILFIENAINDIRGGNQELCLSNKGEDIFVVVKDILFIEASGRKIYVYTNSQSFTSHNKLYELEEMLPDFFVRISKSTIINMKYFHHFKREKSGIGQVFLFGGLKPLYFSRMYYKNLKEYLNK